jgi:hypothetical protein
MKRGKNSPNQVSCYNLAIQAIAIGRADEALFRAQTSGQISGMVEEALSRRGKF